MIIEAGHYWFEKSKKKNLGSFDSISTINVFYAVIA